MKNIIQQKDKGLTVITNEALKAAVCKKMRD